MVWIFVDNGKEAQRIPISGRPFQFSAYIPDLGGKKAEEVVVEGHTIG
jgi:hypothetical protein